MKITKNLIENLIKEELSKIVNEQAAEAFADMGREQAASDAEAAKKAAAEEERQRQEVRAYLKKYPLKVYIPKIQKLAKSTVEQAKEIYKILAFGEETQVEKAIERVMGQKPSLQNRADAAFAEADRAQKVAAQRMPGFQGNPQIKNGVLSAGGKSVKLTPQELAYIQKGGELPKIAGVQGPRESKITKARIESYIMEELANITKEQTALHKKLATQRATTAGPLWNSSKAKGVLDAKLAAGEIDAGTYDIAKQMFMDTVVKLNRQPGSGIDMAAEASAAAMNALEDMGGDVPRQMVAPLPRPR